jgi:cytochrome c oxidase assembly factor CtaG
MLSEPDGTPSSSRCLLFILAFFTMWIIWRVIHHVFTLTDPAIITIYMSNLPLLVTTLIGLMAAPYTINQGKATFADIAQMIANAKQNKIELSGQLGKLTGKTEPTEGVGTPGQKG